MIRIKYWFSLYLGEIANFFFNYNFLKLVVNQYYEADVNKEHVIRGNSAVIKCLIPSFVADFIEVVSWHTDQNEEYFPNTAYGLSPINSIELTSNFHTNFHSL